MKKKILFTMSLITLPIISIPFCLPACSSTSPDEKDIEKCNYTVKAYQETTTNDNAQNFWIGTDIKGYVAGKLFIDNFTESFTCTISGQSEFVGANIYIPKWVDVNGTKYTIIGISNGGTGFQAKVVLPDSFVGIGSSAFYGSTKMTNIIMPASIATIGSSAFYGCAGLTSITIPSSVADIGGHAFYGCAGLTSITIPSSVVDIGGYAFYDCTGLTSITIPSSVADIGDYAFFGCTGLISITLNDFINEPSNWSGWALSYISKKGIVYTTNGTWTSSTALIFCQNHGLSSEWKAG